MAERVNPTVVGAFVVGAVGIAVAGLLVLGGGTFLAKRTTVVAYFPSSVAGLDVGAPVRFRGVQVGRVHNIYAQWNEDGETISIPVELTLYENAVRTPSAEAVARLRNRTPEQFLEQMVQLGLRAELQQDSFVTGKLYVGFDLYPGTPIRRVGGTELFEVPTTEAGLAKLKKSLEDLPVDELIEHSLAVVEAVETIVTDPRIPTLIEDLGVFFGSAGRLSLLTEEKLPGLAETAGTTLDETRAVITQAGSDLHEVSEDLSLLLGQGNERIDSLADDLQGTLQALRGATGRFEALLKADPTLPSRLAALLDELTDAARAIRVLADFLERHPEALLQGKETP